MENEMIDMIEETDRKHPFEYRARRLQEMLYAVTSSGPASWEALFGAASTLDVAPKTVRNAVTEGCQLGLFIKTGGKAGKKFGRPSGPPMVELTEIGARWFEAMLVKTYDLEEPCDTCGDAPTRATKYGIECQRCDEIPDDVEE